MREIKITLLPLLLLLTLSPLEGQITLRQTFDWSEEPRTFEIDDLKWERWSFPEATFNERTPGLPYFHHRFPLNSPGEVKVSVTNVTYEAFNKGTSLDDDQIGERLNFEVKVERDRNRYKGKLSFVPIVKRGQRYERFTYFLV